jgi:hypothetical protein
MDTTCGIKQLQNLKTKLLMVRISADTRSWYLRTGCLNLVGFFSLPPLAPADKNLRTALVNQALSARTSGSSSPSTACCSHLVL